MTRRRIAGATVCAIVVAAAVLVARMGGDRRTLTWVAMGDSYSSGHGNRPYDETAPCPRSAIDAYPLEVARSLRADGVDVDLEFTACPGAVIGDLADQGRSIGPDTDVVTMTIGGNDLGFASLVASCIGSTLASLVPGIEPCLSDIDEIDARLERVRADLVHELTRLTESLRPDATVLLLGYPAVVDDDGGCEAFGPSEAVRAGTIARRLDGTLATAALAVEQVVHVSVAGRFAGHGVCSEEPWIRGLVPDLVVGRVPSVDRSYHPDVEGVRAYARVVERAIDECCV